MKPFRLFQIVLALLLVTSAIGWTAPASRRDSAPYAIHVVVDASAPAGASLIINVKGDSTTYEANHVLASVCVPVMPDSAGATLRVIAAVNGQALGAVMVVFFPSEQLRQVNIQADSAGIHVRRQTALSCTL